MNEVRWARPCDADIGGELRGGGDFVRVHEAAEGHMGLPESNLTS